MHEKVNKRHRKLTKQKKIPWDTNTKFKFTDKSLLLFVEAPHLLLCDACANNKRGIEFMALVALLLLETRFRFLVGCFVQTEIQPVNGTTAQTTPVNSVPYKFIRSLIWHQLLR